MGMNLVDRHAGIVEQLNLRGKVDVAELAQSLDTSEVTIRRDLDQLAQAGVLRRVRGGAVNLMMRGEGMPFAMRTLDSGPVKDRMAVAVASLLRDGEAVTVDSGTSGAAIAKVLADRRLTVMPFSVQALNHLVLGSSVSVLLPGGSVDPSEGSFVGPLAENSLASLRFDSTVLSCCGVSESEGVTAYDLTDAATKKAMIASARRVILVADGAKFARSAMALVCEIESVDVLVTDSSAPAEVISRLRAAGVEVLVVDAAV